ncbi:hypothetical protein [Nonomuraea jabiensis]|uniref:Tyr recombinase domain-containing protein n=1 Tax=Nonomuraea jabiensis TaxID=882448 RepID=A0A7W9LAR6_9ACTN|nr:hypothetical protein [Nonomuraea jabiensis]MBB5776728.1 hypothetical protein [Nonomuraea jabiensis]
MTTVEGLGAGIHAIPQTRAAHRRLDGGRTAIGAPGLHFYDLHRPGSMIAAASGAGLKDLMARIGHDNVRAALIHQHTVRGADKLIIEAIDNHLIR